MTKPHRIFFALLLLLSFFSGCSSVYNCDDALYLPLNDVVRKYSKPDEVDTIKVGKYQDFNEGSSELYSVVDSFCVDDSLTLKVLRWKGIVYNRDMHFVRKGDEGWMSVTCLSYGKNVRF